MLITTGGAQYHRNQEDQAAEPKSLLTFLPTNMADEMLHKGAGARGKGRK